MIFHEIIAAKAFDILGNSARGRRSRGAFFGGQHGQILRIESAAALPARMAVSNRLGHIIYSHGHGVVYSLQLGCAGDKQEESARALSRPARAQFSLADTVFHFRALHRRGGSYRYSLGSHSFDASVFLQNIQNRRLSDYPVSFMGDIRGVSQYCDMHHKLKIHLPQTFL